MKHSIQFTFAFRTALLLALLWFAFWLVAFQPPPVRPKRPKRPELIVSTALQRASAEEISAAQSPTLFALPSEHGFSGRFPPQRILRTLHFTPPKKREFWLEHDAVRAGDPNPAPLFQMAPTSQPQTARPIRTATSNNRAHGLRTHLSPALRARAPQNKLHVATDALPAYTRVRLRVAADGRVSQCFLQQPAPESPLPAAIRRLRFAPAASASDGWMEIRYSPETSSHAH